MSAVYSSKFFRVIVVVGAVMLAAVLVAFVTPQMPAQAAFPGTNGRLVLTKDIPSAGYTSEIFTMNPDGSGLKRLTFNETYDTDPAWSPGGKKIAYTHLTRSGNLEIFVMRADGTQKTKITDSPRASNYDPTWSPNGRRIAFESDRNETNSDANYDIYSVRSDGTDERRITKNTLPESTPDWSPDGTKIAFVTCCPNSGFNITVIDVDGSNRKVLTSTPGSKANPEWSPNGRWIAYEREHEQSGTLLATDLYKIRADGTGVKNVTSAQYFEYSHDPAWSPDGTKIAVRGKRQVRSDSKAGIYLIDPDGSGEKRIPGTEDVDEDSQGLDWQRLPAQ